MKSSERIRLIVCSALIALLAVPAPVVRADEVFTLTAVADATIDQAAPITNDGLSAILRTLSLTAGNKRHLVQFDMTALDPASAAKTSTLRMNMSGPPATTRSLAVHAVNGSTPWTQSGVTWDSRDGATNWTTAGGDFNATPAATQPSGTAAGTVSWNILTDGTISNIPQNWISNPGQNLGLLVKDTTENDAPHAIINKVIAGNSPICTPGPCTTTVTFSGGQSVDTTKSFLMFGVQGNNSTNQASNQIRGVLANSTQVTFFRAADAPAMSVDWFVVEYLQGVSVQRGTVTQSATTPPVTIDIPIVPPAGVSSISQMFAIVSKNSGNEGTMNLDNPVVADVTATNNLRIRFGQGNAGHTIAWQVVSFLNPADINVQRGTATTLALAVTSETVALATPVDPAKTFVLASWRSSSPSFAGLDIGGRLVRAQLSNCTTTCTSVTVDRATGGDTITEVHFQAITLNDGSSVQSGAASFASGVPPATFNQTVQTVGISTVDVARSFAFASTQGLAGQGTGRSPWIGNQNANISTYGFQLAASTLTMTRGFNQTNATTNSDVAWNVVQAPNYSGAEAQFSSLEDSVPANRPQLDVSLLRNVTPGVITPGISEVTLNWTFPTGSTSLNYDGVLFARTAGGAPTFVPVDGVVYTAGQIFGADAIAANTSSFATVSLFDENGPDNVVLPSTAYTYNAHTHDANTITGATIPAPPHYSSGLAISTTTLTPGPTDKNWSYRTGAASLSPPGFTTNGTVIAGSNDAKLHSMDSTTGARRYQPAGLIGTTGGAIQSRPPIIPASFTTNIDCDSVTVGIQPCDITFVGDSNGDVFAFDVNTGNRVWTTSVAPGGSIQGAIAVQLAIVSNGGFTPTCAPCDLVFVGTRLTADAVNNSVVALNAGTGAVEWTFQPGNMDIIISTPMVDYENNFIWVTSLSNGNTQPSLWKIESSTGAFDETFNLGDISGSPAPSATRRTLYVLSDAGELHAIRTDIGGCITSGTGVGTAVGSPVPSWQSPTDDDIYFSTSSSVHKFHFTLAPASCGTDVLTDLDGSGWTNPALTNPSGVVVLPTPIVPSTIIFVGDGTGRLRRIDPATGAIAASQDVELGNVIGEPALDIFNNKIFVGSSSGRIFSFNFF